MASRSRSLDQMYRIVDDCSLLDQAIRKYRQKGRRRNKGNQGIVGIKGLGRKTGREEKDEKDGKSKSCLSLI